MNRNQENIEGSESPAIGPADRLLQPQSSDSKRKPWHAVFNPDNPRGRVEHNTNSKEATRSRSSSPRASNSRTMNRRMADCWSRIPRPKIPPMPKMPTWLRTNALTILSVLGVFLGAVIAMIMRFSREERWTEREIVYVGFVGELFLRMLKCLILPLIVSSLVSAIGSLDLSLSGRIGIRAIVYYMTTTLSAVILGIVLVVTIHPGRGSEDGITRAGTTRHVMSNDILMDLVRNLFPPNLVQACFAQYKTVLHPPMDYEESKNDSLMNPTTEPGNVTKPDLHLWKMSGEWENSTNILGLVVFSITLGITLGKLGPKGKPLLSFFVCLSESMMQITSWVIWTSPVGVLSLVAAKMLEMESWEVMLGQLGMYFLTVMLGLFIHGFIVLFSIFFFVTRKLPFRFVGNMFEALATAFATSSSSATLPVALQCLEEKNGIDPRVTRFVMPIGATINMDGTALYEAVAAIFISQVRNIRLSLGNIAAISITATAASIGAAGIPQAGLVTMVMVLDTVGLTAEDVTLILAIDWFLDRFRTFTNVLGDSLGAGIVHHLSKKELADLPQTIKESNIPPVDLEASADAIDLEKGESNGLTTAKSNVTSTRVDVEYQATSM